MAHSNHIILKKKHQFSSLLLSDPELDELEKYPPDDEEPEDIPFDEVIHENSPRRKNIPVETPVKENHGQLPLERASTEDEKSFEE